MERSVVTALAALLLAGASTTALAHGVAGGARPPAHGPAHPGRPIAPPVFAPAVVVFNPFVPAFVTATPVVVYGGALPSAAEPPVATPLPAETPAGARPPGTGRWLVGEMPSSAFAPAARAHAGTPVLEVRRTTR
ncbi:MAG: hypothetical protein N2544_06850 [Burkholderiales bacterium]|nr:hypothetical protein [Burkholderiales bacterium]